MKTRVYFGAGAVVSFLSSSYMVAPLRSQENCQCNHLTPQQQQDLLNFLRSL